MSNKELYHLLGLVHLLREETILEGIIQNLVKISLLLENSFKDDYLEKHAFTKSVETTVKDGHLKVIFVGDWEVKQIFMKKEIRLKDKSCKLLKLYGTVIEKVFFGS